jgi:hypothetical protein
LLPKRVTPELHYLQAKVAADVAGQLNLGLGLQLEPVTLFAQFAGVQISLKHTEPPVSRKGIPVFDVVLFTTDPFYAVLLLFQYSNEPAQSDGGSSRSSSAFRKPGHRRGVRRA